MERSDVPPVPRHDGQLGRDMPEDHEPGTPPGMSTSDVNERFDIAIYLPPGKLPASRATIIDLVRDAGAPGYVVAAVWRLPAEQEFSTIGEVVRAMGISTEAAGDAEYHAGT